MSIELLKARLTELGGLLGRDVPLSGSRKDLESRVSELEEEVAARDELPPDGDERGEGDGKGSGGDNSGSDDDGGDDEEDAVTVLMLSTVDIPCRDMTGSQPDYALAGSRVVVSAQTAGALRKAGLAR